jgi:integrase
MKPMTVKQLEALEGVGRHNCGDGLYLEIDPVGNRRWLYRYQFQGKRTNLGLGGYCSKSNGLKIARERVTEFKALIARGTDPQASINAKKQALEASRRAERAELEAASNSFQVVAYAWYEASKAQWKNGKHVAQNINTLRDYVFPIIGSKPIADCGVSDVLACLKPIWEIKTETASRVRQRIEKVFNYAKAAGMRTGENPAQWKNNLDALLPPAGKIKRQRALKFEHGGNFPSMPYQEVPSFYAELNERTGASVRMLQLVILTASRTGPILLMKWKDIDFKNSVWSISKQDMKASRAFKVPLVPEAVRILSEIPRVGDYVFPTPRDIDRPMSNNSMLALLRRIGRDDITVHGFRTSFRTWAEELTDEGLVAEHALAHLVGDKTVQSYQRSDLFDRRRCLMNSWANFVTERGETL